MKPIGKYIIIKAVKDKPEESKGGLLITGSSNSEIRYTKGLVTAIGTDVNPIIKVGSDIYYDKHAGFSMDIKGELFLVIKEMDIVIVL